MGIEALKTKVLIWGLFMSTTVKAAIHLRPNYVEILEVYRNTNFEEIQDLFVTAQKLILDHQAEILNVTRTGWTAPSWTRSTLVHDQVIKWAKAKVHVYTDSVLCLEKMQEHSGANKKWIDQLREFQQSNSYIE